MKGDTEITNSEDVIDSREVEARIEYLTDNLTCAACGEAANDANTAHADEQEAEKCRVDDGPAHPEDENGHAYKATCDEFTPQLDEDELTELRALEAFRDEASTSEWVDGVTLVRESYFEDYAREYAEDIHGDGVRQAEWPFDCIDWGQAADELRMDYTGADFDGVTYYYR